MSEKIQKIPTELDNLCLEVGKFIEYWGFKEIEGRLWCHILLSNRPLCPQDLINRTGVSKGLVSLSLSRLLEYEVIRLEYIEGRRTQFYQVNENVTKVIKEVLRKREKQMLKDVEKAVKSLKSVPKEMLKDLSFHRIDFLMNLVRTASNYLRILLIGTDKLTNFIFEKAPFISKKEAVK